jgi:hypothetical protein
MVANKGEEGNKGVLHTLVDVGMYHTLVVVGCMDCGVLWYQSIHLLSETSQVCPGLMVWFSRGQVVLYISILTVNK